MVLAVKRARLRCNSDAGHGDLLRALAAACRCLLSWLDRPATHNSLGFQLVFFPEPRFGRKIRFGAFDAYTRVGLQVKRIAIIGAGITGLAAAHRLGELAAQRETPVETVILERSDRMGGPLKTIRRDGFVMETGADSFLTEKPAAAGLAKRLGLANELIPTRAQFRRTLVVHDGKLVEIPEGFSLLAPTHLEPVMESPLFSEQGKRRIALEPTIPRRTETGDESLASFVTRRLGQEVLERVAQPLAGGIYTADPARLSVAATMPRFLEMEKNAGSVIRGLQAAEKAWGARGPAPAAPDGACFCRCARGWDPWWTRLPRELLGRFACAPRWAASRIATGAGT